MLFRSRFAGILSLLLLVIGFAASERILSFAEAQNYPDKVIYSRSSRYQRIVLTKSDHDLRLFLNGNLQFSSRDEYRYHEALVHPGLASVENPKNILVLGGGDGMAVREILRYPSVESVTLVDLDPDMTGLFSRQTALSELNGRSLLNPKVKVIHADAFVWLKENRRVFDFIAIDFPDPSNFSIGKLYTNTFYRFVRDALSEKGIAVVQSTSPYVARDRKSTRLNSSHT